MGMLDNIDMDDDFIGIVVCKRDGTEEGFSRDKASNSIMQAALQVGGEDYDLADSLADKLEDMLEENGITKVTSQELEKLIKDLLIDEGHSATATEYIVYASERNKIRELNSEMMKTMEEITFTTSEESDSKRENANINSNTSMGTMLKYGSETAKKFNLERMISPKIAAAHKNGDIHIHDLDFYSLAWTCICEDTRLTIRVDGKDELNITAKELKDKFFNELETPDKLVENTKNIEVMCNGKFVKAYNFVTHSSEGKKVLKITFPSGELQVTDNHVISVINDNGKVEDKKASELKVGDTLVTAEINPDRFNTNKLSENECYELGKAVGNKLKTLKECDEYIINSELYTVNKECTAKFLEALIESNNCFVDNTSKIVKIHSKCKSVLKDIQLLLLLRGITSRLTVNDNYELVFNTDFSDKNALLDNTKIESIEEVTDYTGLVYDMQTETHHFDANGIVVHNCDHIPLDTLFKGGFNTGHGFLREPGNIRTAGALAAIAIQSNQNDMYGGQAIPLFDYYLAPYVAITYVKRLADACKKKFDLEPVDFRALRKMLLKYHKEHKLVMSEEHKEVLKTMIEKFFNTREIEYTEKGLNKSFEYAYEDTYDETYQSMEAFIHNMNTLHSRAGSQVPFSSVNFGTDTSVEGRMVTETFLLSAERGLGYGELPIFPISIFKMKAGVNYNPEDPNYDLFELACRVSAATLYPNFVNLDAPYNAELYVPGHPETEMATMGCVESSEILTYKIGDEIFVETFSDAYNRVKALKKEVQHSLKSVYLDCSDGTTVEVWDSYSDKFVKVNKFIRNSDVNNWKVIKLSDGYSITATDDHPLPIVNKGRTFVKDIKSGDRIKVSNIKYTDKFNDELNTVYFGNEAWLLGVILADSSYSDQINISLGLDEYDIVEAIEDIVNKLGYTVRITEQHRGTKGDYVDIAITGISSNKDARAELASLFGGYIKNDRRITSMLLTTKREYRVKLLAGLIDADGHITVSKGRRGDERSARFSIGSTNKALAMTELALIRSLGYNAKLYRNKYSSKHKKIRYLVEFGIEDELVKELKCAKKIEKATTVGRCQYAFVDTVEVVSITDGCEENENASFSYDLETESDRLDISFIQSHNCRTRVGKNVYDPDKSVIPGRGNLSFTSINLPRLGIKAQGNIDTFYKLLDDMMELVHEQLLERFEVQCKRHMINHPFLLGQGNWLGSDRLGPLDDIRAVLKHGTLAVGFIGLAETLVALTGKHHGESEKSQKLGLEIVQHMRDFTDAWSEEEKMNYGVIGTPAEGLSGRFLRIDREKYGIINGVTDKEYYTNSNHIPVNFEISAFKKIQLEAPYHALLNGGHIAYIEMDGDPTHNLQAFKNIVRFMHDNNIGYASVNHPVDSDSVCGYRGIIGDTCPRCGRREGEAMTMEMWQKVKGYAGAGNSATLGYHGDINEENDRLTNSLEGIE